MTPMASSGASPHRASPQMTSPHPGLSGTPQGVSPAGVPGSASPVQPPAHAPTPPEGAEHEDKSDKKEDDKMSE